MRPTRRQDLIDAATALFSSEGFRAVGIDRILAAANAAKMTLYNNFGSKDELIAAVLQQQHERFMADLEAAAEAVGSDPVDRIMAIVEFYGRWFGEPGFNGCLFASACAEFPDPSCPVQRAVCSHMDGLRQVLASLAGEAGASEPGIVADALIQVLTGATFQARLSCAVSTIEATRFAVEVLLERSLCGEDSLPWLK